MRFTTPDSRPSLTPLGHRLLSLSERKLAILDGVDYDEGHALRKGLLVRQAVQSAWQSVEDGSVAELTNWHKHGALGLDVLTEEDEEYFSEEVTEENSEARWFENLVSSFGDDEAYPEVVEAEHEWIESSVSMPELEDDLEYDAGNMVAFELPLPVSPTSLPSSPITVHVTEPSIQVEVSEVAVEVSEVDVDEDEGYLVLQNMIPRHHRWTEEVEQSIPLTPILYGLASPPLQPQPSPLPHPSPLQLNSNSSASEFLSSPNPYPQYFTDFEEYIDDFFLPPPLLRSMSASTTSSLDDEDEVCTTPPLRSVELDREDEVEVEEKVIAQFRDMWRGSEDV